MPLPNGGVLNVGALNPPRDGGAEPIGAFPWFVPRPFELPRAPPGVFPLLPGFAGFAAPGAAEIAENRNGISL